MAPKKSKAANTNTATATDEPTTRTRKLKRKNRESEEESGGEEARPRARSGSPSSEHSSPSSSSSPPPKKSSKSGAKPVDNTGKEKEKDLAEAPAEPVLASKKSMLAGLSFKKRKSAAEDGANVESTAPAPAPSIPLPEKPAATAPAAAAPALEPAMSAIAARKLREDVSKTDSQNLDTPGLHTLPPVPAPRPDSQMTFALPPRPGAGATTTTAPAPDTLSKPTPAFTLPKSKFDLPPVYKSKPRDPDAPDTDRVPKKLTYTTVPWTSDETDALKSALKKYGIPAPTSDSLRKEGLWYSSVSKWSRIAAEIKGRTPAEARFQFFGKLQQQM